ncbi:hypothetical protein L914_08643 [Phytophthora nicotianae]|uniref:Uncharacterized protein n=1 Tax=Phytophthora nicotianae TaxID=4792 RepID=W2NEX4_PHYNI|nr:hypothetical protein L914_08643 [Phytophthora nicotianae]
MTPAEETRLAYDRKKKRQKRAQRDTKDESEFPTPVPAKTLKQIQQECIRRLSNACLQEFVCCVCDCWHPVADILQKTVRASPQLLKAMAKRLKSPQGLHEELLMCYDVSSQIPALKGALLSPMGINNGGRELYVCKPCFNSLMNKKLRSPPKFAIANGLYIGLLPEEYMDTNATEHAMLGLAQSTRMLTVVRGGNHSAIRAHAYYFRAVPSTPASLLPREVISDGTIGVTMIGSMTPQQKAATFKQYNVRVPRLISLLEWNEPERAQAAIAKQHVIVRRSSAIMSDFDKPFWIYAFVELFPFGRGGLDEPRSIPIGIEEYIRYCLRLSPRRHARHHSFTFVAFDVLARHRAMQAVYLRAKMAPSAVAMTTSIRREELVEHLRSRENHLQNLSKNTFGAPAPHAEQNIRNLFSLISTGMRAHFGSNEERSRARSNLLAMQLAYGQPSIFFTISPSSSSSYRVAALGGAVEDELLDAVNQELT